MQQPAIEGNRIGCHLVGLIAGILRCVGQRRCIRVEVFDMLNRREPDRQIGATAEGVDGIDRRHDVRAGRAGNDAQDLALAVVRQCVQDRQRSDIVAVGPKVGVEDDPRWSIR